MFIKLKEDFIIDTVKGSIKISKTLETVGLINLLLWVISGFIYSLVVYDYTNLLLLAFVIIISFTFSGFVSKIFFDSLSMILKNLAINSNKK